MRGLGPRPVPVPEPGRGSARRLRLPRTRRGWRRTYQAVVVLTALALAPATWLNASAGPRVRKVADVPAAPVAVVFGAGLWDGEPSPYLAHRLDAAAELYERGTVRAILVTGDNSRRDYDEPAAMRGYLLRHGIPAGRIVSDHAGFDTWDSCSRAHRVFGVDKAVLVSQGFHIRRALSLCAAAGIESYGVGVAAHHDVTWAYGGVREIFAAGKATAEALLRPDPHFLGPRETGLAEALR
ncbi:SanA/YdcF family protein [Streptomyces celluloflavus]|uniref:SanA/YdcF family protein n=1 Tax=Streptomyces celluloflavus TaxID=58344 RepID=UPI003460991A|nr:YdcF family protein [Streptomyces celluloflavus]